MSVDQQRDWSDVALDEINMAKDNDDTIESANSSTMVIPQRRSGFWTSRTGMEKALMGVLGVCGMVMIAGGCVIAVQASGSSQGVPSEKADSRMMTMGDRQADICVTPECVVAAGDIIQSLDESMDPCDDFFRFACGGWIDSNVIPDANSRWGRFNELREKVDIAVRSIVESPILPTDAMAVENLKNHYAACLDTDTIDAQGYTSMLSVVLGDEYGGWPMIQNVWDDSNFLWEGVAGSNLRRYITDTVMVLYPYLDSFDTSQNVLYIDQPSFGLPRSMFEDPVGFAEYVDAYKAYIVGVATVLAREAGQTDVEQSELMTAADRLFEFERQLAMRSVPDEDRRNSTEMYNPYLVSELKTEFPIDWDAYLGNVFADTGLDITDSERVILVEPEYFIWIAPTIAANTIASVADYMYWRRIMGLVGEGPQEFRELQFQFNAALYGLSQESPRWSTCISKASAEDRGFAYAVGAEYVKENFDDQTKAEADAMVNDIRIAFEQLLDGSTWMDPATQVLAYEKAELIVQLIGYPDWVLDNAALDAYYQGVRPTTPTTHFDNIAGVLEYAANKGLNTLRKTPNREDWITQPAIVNAFYSPVHNSISFPAGILQPPFFGKGYPRYLNYGAIGVVMGHEITHGFDDQGRQYDGVGNIAQWWSDETIAAFTEKAQCYIDQYDGYVIDELVPDLGEDAHVNGQNTQGENIADNGGLHQAYTAYMNSNVDLGLEGTLPGLTQYTPEKMFFISYAQLWCEKATHNGLLNQVLTDPHSPGKYRVWGPLSNSPDFVRTFNCPAGSNMNREEKCDLW